MLYNSGLIQYSSVLIYCCLTEGSHCRQTHETFPNIISTATECIFVDSLAQTSLIQPYKWNMLYVSDSQPVGHGRLVVR